MEWKSMAVVGRIARSHGRRGEVIVNPETDFLKERFQPGAELFVERRGVIELLTLTSARFQRDRPVVGIAGVGSIDAAQALAGLELRVPVDWLLPLPEGSFYHHDLVGCRVETTSGEIIGMVREVEGSRGGSRLVVTGARGELLIPLATEICTTIDSPGRRIVIDPPDGLLELNE